MVFVKHFRVQNPPPNIISQEVTQRDPKPQPKKIATKLHEGEEEGRKGQARDSQGKQPKRGNNDFSLFIDETLEALAFKKFQDKAFLQRSLFKFLSVDPEEFKNNLEETIDRGVL